MLRAAEVEFDALVTMDRGIPHQQNLEKLDLGIVLVRAFSNRRADVAPLIPQVSAALRTLEPRDRGVRREHRPLIGLALGR